MRIDVVPDDVLLGIFDFYVHVDGGPLYKAKKKIEVWQSLVHVCRRWRNLVLGSPSRLNLQLCCTPQTPTRGSLDVWPALPLIINGDMTSSSDMDNVIAALGQSNRVREVDLLYLAGWQLEKVLAQMQVPFPELTVLQFLSLDETPPVPNSFLGGTAPRLRIFALHYNIQFLGLPKLLLSATHLARLELYAIPHSGYFPPEALASLLSTLSSLEIIILDFRSPQSHPDWGSRRPPPSIRSVVPALTYFCFKGVVEYLERLVTFIDAPQLDHMDITFFNQIDYNIPQLAQFISHTPKFWARGAYVQLGHITASVSFQYQTSNTSVGDLQINISCRTPDWQLSSIERVCNSSLPPLPTVKDLYIERRYSKLAWKDDAVENNMWLELLLPFTAVENLFLHEEFVPGIEAALQELVESRITDSEVLPNLQNIFVEEIKPWRLFQQFVAARQLSGRPIAISVWRSNN